MILWCWYRGIRLFKLDGSLPLGLLVGVLFSLEFALLYIGLAMTDVSRAVLFIYTSPFVTALSFDYYDATTDTWSTEEELQKDSAGNYETPRRIRLKFHRKDRDYEEIITLPATAQGLPAY